MALKAAIAGATGYTGSELVRILTLHPEAEITAISSESKTGEPFSSIHPQYQGIADTKLTNLEELAGGDHDVVFLALPHGAAMGAVKEHKLDRFTVIDLSADFRLPSTELYQQWYKLEHIIPELLDKAVYGLPELFKPKIKDAAFIANPGCYPTSVILALAPLVKAGVVETKGIVADSKSGVTGAGAKAKPNTHFPDVFGNFSAYGLFKHRHTPEMESQLAAAFGADMQLLFTPHLLPVDRGILSTVYTTPVESVDGEKLAALYKEFYEDAPFVRVVDKAPSIKQVRGSNYCDIFCDYDSRTNRVVTVAVLDNLVKGAAGQAVQNMNIRFGLPEDTGIRTLPLHP